MQDWGSIATWASVALSAAALIYTIIANRRKDSDAKLAALEIKLEDKASKAVVDGLVVKVDKVEDRVTTIDGELKHLPDKDVTHRLELALAGMRTEVRELAATVKPIGSTMSRLQDVLLERIAEK